MSYLLPPANHPAREMFDVADLVAIGQGIRDRTAYPCDLAQAKSRARAVFASGNPAIKRLIYIIMRAESDEIHLVSVGPRGGHKVEWNFSQ